MSAVTDELIAGNLVVVSGSEDGCSPFYRRVASIAESSTRVSVFRTGGSFILECYGSVNVGRAVCGKVLLIHICHTGVHFRINVELLVGEGARATVDVSDKAEVDVHLHILSPEGIGGPIGFCRITGSLDVGIEIKNTDRELGKDCRAGFIVITGTGDGDSSRIGFCVYGVLCGEAISKLHIIELPMVYVIEVDNGFNRLNSFDSICLEIHPVNRAEGDSVKSCIRGNELQRGILNSRFNLDNTDNYRLVAYLIRYFELNTMITVRNNDAVCRKNATRESRFNLNTVDIYFSGIGIQAGNVINSIGVLICINQEVLILDCSRKI